MPRKNVHIEQLHLRVPAMSRTQATALGEQVARGLQQGVQARHISEQIDSLSLRITAPDGVRGDGLTTMIVERILLGLSR